MRTKKTKIQSVIIIAVIFLSTKIILSQSIVTIEIEPQKSIAAIPEEFSGLSFEMQKVLPDKEGNHFFSSENKNLIAIFKMLGIKNLRVGGNTADRTTVDVPNEIDIDNLFAFAKSAGVKVIYTVRLREGDPNRAAEIVKYITAHYKSELDCIEIGNEPNVFEKEYQLYKVDWKKFVDVITADGNAKGILFCGPSATPGKASWSGDFARDFGKSGLLKYTCQHAYPGGGGTKVTDPAAARADMLSSNWVKLYRNFSDSFVPTVEENGLTYRIEETNNYYSGGAKDVSETFASALWGLDYIYWWASNKAAGINFHTGDAVAAGENTKPCLYAVFTTSGSGYFLHPLGYAIKAFDIARHGKLLNTSTTVNKDSINFTSYAVKSKDKNIFVTLINKENGQNARNAICKIITNEINKNYEVMYLKSSSGNLAATAGIKLGNAEIKDDGTWSGKWEKLKRDGKSNDIIVDLPASSAAIIKVTMR